MTAALILPDTLAQWPWKRKISPHYLQVKTESLAWIQNFTMSTPHLQRAIDLGDCSLLVALAYPLKNKDILRAACDFMNFSFFFDDLTDGMTPHEAHQIITIVKDAMRNPDHTRPVDECVIGEAACQLWNSLSKYASVGASRRFIKTFNDCITCIAQQAQDHAQNYTRTIDDYFLVCRETIGVALAVLEFGLNLPEEVFEDPVVQRIINACAKMVFLANDMCSYNKEQARGNAGHNIVTVLLHHENLSLDEAMKWISDYHSKLVRTFLDDLRNAPSFGEDFQGEVESYLSGIGNWVRANNCWSFESYRYFGAKGFEVQQSRKVDLLPPSRSMP